MNRLRSWFPAPLLSAVLLAAWLVLAREASATALLAGLAVAIAVPRLSVRLRVGDVRIRRPRRALRLVVQVCADVVVSNAAVARGVVGWRVRRPSSRFVRIPLELRDPTGLAMLALITTIVPGTVWCELAADRGSLLLHVWDAADEADFIARYKSRYEAPLREIFE